MSGTEHLRGVHSESDRSEGVLWVFLIVMGLLNIVSLVMSIIQASNLQNTAEIMATMENIETEYETARMDIKPVEVFIDRQQALHVSRSVDNLLTHRIKKNL